MRHDLELGQRGRLGVLNSRCRSRALVDLHPGVSSGTYRRWSKAVSERYLNHSLLTRWISPNPGCPPPVETYLGLTPSQA